jgi:hypothetical protein
LEAASTWVWLVDLVMLSPVLHKLNPSSKLARPSLEDSQSYRNQKSIRKRPVGQVVQEGLIWRVKRIRSISLELRRCRLDKIYTEIYYKV